MDVLFVPVHIDALVLDTPQKVLGPLARFERLPWTDPATPHNGDVPWLGPSIEVAAFTEPDTTLARGVHLHWTLPDGLTRRTSGQDFPAAPDRWYVRRAATGTWPEMEWLVESDWQEPSDLAGPERTLFPRFGADGRPPWQARGRILPFADWRVRTEVSRTPVTALGYGEPLFAAYYPSARGMFGLHDPDAPTGVALTYDLIGWYGQGADDPLAATPRTLGWLKDRLHWLVDGDATDSAPGRVVCYARLSIAVGTRSRQTLGTTAVAVAHTGVEALAALAASGATASDAERIETAASAVLHASQLAHLEVDHAQELATAVHEQGFLAEPGGHRWSLRRRVDNPSGADADPSLLRDNPPPPSLVDRLDQLNALQQGLDRARRTLRALREQLLADWSKMMMVFYPATPDSKAPLDPAEMLDFLQHAGLEPIASLEAAIGTRIVNVDGDGLLSLGAAVAGDTHEGRVAVQAARIARKLEVFNATGLSGQRVGAPVLQAETGADPAYLTFDGSGDALVLDTIEGWGTWPNLGDGPALYALTLWIRLRVTTPLAAPVLSFGADQHLALSIGIQGGQPQVIFTLCDTGGTAHELRSAVSLVPGQWVDVVAVYDGVRGEQHLWLDGKDAGVNVLPDAPLIGTAALRWGVLGAASQGEAFGAQAAAGPFSNCDVARLVILPNQALPEAGRAMLVDRKLPPPLRLAREAGARFWRPRDPVVMVKGEAVRATGRYHRGDLPCHRLMDPVLDALNSTDRSMQAQALPVLRAQLDKAVGTANDVGALSTDGAPWHPLYMEWQTALHSYLPDVTDDMVRYNPDCLTAHFELDPSGPDLHPRGGLLPTVMKPVVATGRAILTPFADDLMAARTVNAKTAGVDIDAFDPAAAAALKAQVNTQSQALSGFHAAIIQHRHGLALPPDDPHAIPPEATGRERSFSQDTIRNAVYPRTPGPTTSVSAATPNGPFMPLRAGLLELTHLRIVDAFGQTLDWPVTHVARPLTLGRVAPGVGGGMGIMLPARLAQPARLNFRWLSARTGTEEANDQPLSSPICGWVVASYLDQALAFHEANGAALGEVTPDPEQPWRSAPGGRVMAPERFADPALGRVAQLLSRQVPNRRLALLAAIADSLNSILPTISGVSPALALAAGRPLAVVRARIGIELRDPFAINQSWSAFAGDLRRAGGESSGRHDAGMPNIRVPVRLGEHGRLEDGLVGFWLEDSAGLPVGPFHMPAASGTIDDIVGPDDPNFLLRLPLGGPPRTVTMLIDPSGKVHATSGLLPVKAISVPRDYFDQTLRTLETWFLTAPLLSPSGRLEVPLPAIDGRSWAWRERVGDGWENLPSGALRQPRQDAAFDGPAELREGWLILTPDLTR